jgi:hypothetical protein
MCEVIKEVGDGVTWQRGCLRLCFAFAPVGLSYLASSHLVPSRLQSSPTLKCIMNRSLDRLAAA